MRDTRTFLIAILLAAPVVGSLIAPNGNAQQALPPHGTGGSIGTGGTLGSGGTGSGGIGPGAGTGGIATGGTIVH